MWFRNTIRREVEAIVAKQLAGISVKPEAILPKTYVPLPEIRRGMYQYVYVPFGDAHVWMELRSLNSSQIQECGNIALIEVVAKKGKASRADVISLRNTQEQLARAVMNSPTYAEFEALIYGHDNVIRERRRELAEIQERVKGNAALEREFKADIESLEMFLGYILPENTLLFLTRWALGMDISDVKKLTADRLLEAAVLAKRGNDNPHDHITGVLTDRDMGEIDQAAWYLYAEKYERRGK